MQQFRSRSGWLMVSSPLLISLLAACDSQSPAFVEHGSAYGSIATDGSEYSQEAGSGADSTAADTGSAEDPARDDRTPADKGESTEGPALALAKWTFDSSRIMSSSLNLDAGVGEIEQRVTMANNVVASKLEFQQINRPVVTETFPQGSEEVSRNESFQQTASASGLLDILVVIDNSNSMKEEQSNLSTKMMPLLSYVGNSDWKIGVVTTDPQDGCLRGLIKKSDAQPSQLFAQAVNAGIQGSGNERGILQAVNGLKGQCNSTGSWLRSNSTVAVLIVSDEDNCSNGLGCGSDPWSNADYLVNYLASIRQVGVNARVYGLAWHPSQAQSACRTAAYQGKVYANAISRTGGSWGSICASDYTNTLQAISMDLSTILKTQFALQTAPSQGSMKVYVNNVLQSSGYQVRGNVLEFSQAPAAGASIRAEYSFETASPKKEFALAHPADAQGLQVYVDGNLSQGYSYDAAAKSIVFSEAPRGLEIKTVYRSAEEQLQRDFALSGTVKSGSLAVTVDGQQLNSTQFSLQTGLVRLAQAPRDGAKVEVSFQEVIAPQLRYAVNVPEAQLNRVRVIDAVTERGVNFQVEGREIVFAAGDYQANRTLIVRYPASGEGAWTVDLGESLVQASVKVVGSQSGACTAVKVSGTEVDLSACHFTADEGISIDYDYAGDLLKAFDLGTLDIDLSQVKWQVTVNGQVVENYSISRNHIEFPDLPALAQIEVTLYK